MIGVNSYSYGYTSLYQPLANNKFEKQNSEENAVKASQNSANIQTNQSVNQDKNQVGSVFITGAEASVNFRLGVDPAEMAVRSRIQYQDAGQNISNDKMGKINSDGQKTEQLQPEEECQTCKNRKYQDGSDDPGVSFKTPTNVAPEQAANAVRSHEMEHVVRERAKADKEGREVVSQSVAYHTGICPECGDVYVSGGTTTTVTRDKQDNTQNHIPFEAVA